MGLFSCKHRFGTIQADGYQYCQKCGLAKKPPCQHKWEVIERYSLIRDTRYGDERLKARKLIKSCTLCGEIVSDTISLELEEF